MFANLCLRMVDNPYMNTEPCSTEANKVTKKT